MVRVFSTRRFSPLWLILFLPLFFVLSVPLILLSVLLALVGGLMGRRLRTQAPPRASSTASTGVSPLIDNPEIGPYRIKQNPLDPSVIEVLD